MWFDNCGGGLDNWDLLRTHRPCCSLGRFSKIQYVSFLSGFWLAGVCLASSILGTYMRKTEMGQSLTIRLNLTSVQGLTSIPSLSWDQPDRFLQRLKLQLLLGQGLRLCGAGTLLLSDRCINFTATFCFIVTIKMRAFHNEHCNFTS